MDQVIEMAGKNAADKKGGPFAAIVADSAGVILGVGKNSFSSRFDPIAHAEIMAIRQAAEKLGRADLSDCALYCSSEPTMMAKALIASVGIKTVYYGLSHENIRTIRPDMAQSSTDQAEYIQLHAEQALEMFKIARG